MKYFGILIIFAVTTSCIKTYTCKCEPTGTNTQETFEFEVKATKKAAEEGCESEYESSADYWDCSLL